MSCLTDMNVEWFGLFSQLTEKKRVKTLLVEKKYVPLQADYYQISDKRLIYSALLCLFVSDEMQVCR